MRTIRITLLLLLAVSVLAGCKQKSSDSKDTGETTSDMKPELISKWSTDSVLDVPESVYYDAGNEVLYVSNIQGKPTEKDGKGFISKVSPEGDVIQLKWVTGIDAPKGMGVYDGKLYVTNIDELVEIDISGGEIENRYALEGSKFANDIAIDEEGSVFISDMATGSIYRLKGDKAEKWIESDKLESPNGLYTEKDHLLIGMKGAVMKADYKTGELVEFISNTGGIDGLKKVGDGYYIKSDWEGRVHLLHPETEKQLLLNTTDKEINAADIEYVPEKNMLYVPTFFDNRVMAYNLERKEKD